MEKLKYRVPIFKNGVFDHFDFHDFEVVGNSYNAGRVQYLGKGFEIKEPELFTGLTDKNGKDIYEGDILKVDDAIMHVIWSQKFASFGLDKVGWAFIHYFGEAVDPENCEVIGNIHENKQ